jgi:peptide/nickel transport system substrate-binding protein
VRIPTPSDGGKTYAFRLREGVRYSTGEQVAPEDVRHSFERVLGRGGPVAGFFSAIVGARSCVEKQGRCDLSEGIVTSEDSRTVTFHLTHPDPEFIAKLATPPASVLPVTVPMDIQVTVPSTGPYDVVDYDPEKQVVLERRDDFEPWATAAQSGGYAERIVVQMDYTGQASRAVLAGHADWTDVSGDDVTALRRRHGSHIREFPRPATFAVFLNTKVPPFDDVDVRRALNLAVDREIVQQTFGGSEQATITCQILPPRFTGVRTLLSLHGRTGTIGTVACP